MSSGKFTGQDIIREFEQKILSNKLEPGIRLETSSEISRRYNVSLKTVERAMKHLSKRGLVKRIKGCGTFVLSNQHMLDRPRICFLTFIQPHYIESSPVAFFAAFGYLEQKIQHELAEAGYCIDHINETTEFADQRDALLKMRLEKYDIIIVPGGALEYAQDLLRSCKSTKILILNDEVCPGPWHQIVYDYRPGFDRALELFDQLNCPKIIAVGFADDETSDHRIAVFREEAQRLGFASDRIEQYLAKDNLLSHFWRDRNSRNIISPTNFLISQFSAPVILLPLV